MRAQRITTGKSNDQLLYFTSSSLSSDDSALYFLTDRTGHPNLFVMDLATGDEKQLTANEEGYLKSYVYFDGNEHVGLGKASVCLHSPSGSVYYIQGRNLCRTSAHSSSQVLAELPAGQVTAFLHVSDDGSRICVPTTDARALEGYTSGHADYDIDRRVREERLDSWLRVYDAATGSELACERVNSAWITHVQFCPTDNNLILYNHEWPSDCGIRRMWLWDGKKHIRLRTEGQGRSREDWTCHEMWTRDGSQIIYHGSYCGGDHYIGKLNRDGSGMREIRLPAGYTSYGHFTVGNGGVLVTDGHYRTDGDDDSYGRWICALNVDWENGVIEWVPLCRHGSDWDSQDSHPHPIFSHQGTTVYFTSNADGQRAVYKTEMLA